MATIISWLLKNYKTVLGAVLGLSVALLLGWGTMLHKQNKKLSERLETAFNNIEAYQGIVSNNEKDKLTLQLTIQDMQESKDSLLQQLDSVRAANKIKPSVLTSAATQTQHVNVNGGKGVQGDLTVILKDTTYADSISYNPLTKVYYTIGKDTVDINIDLQNTQYLYTYKHKEYKNKKSFIKRLFTLDFKKVTKSRYEIVNTNNLINTSDVRVIEIIK